MAGYSDQFMRELGISDDVAELMGRLEADDAGWSDDEAFGRPTIPGAPTDDGDEEDFDLSR